MQIFEITQPKKINEALGGALMAIGKGIAKAGFDKAVQSQTGSSAFEPPTAGANARMGAFKANQALVGPLATQLQAAWAQAVQEFMSRTKDAAGNPATNLSALSPATFGTIKPQLITLINNSIGQNANYEDLPKRAGSDPTVQGAAQAVKDAIDKGITDVMDATVKPGNNSRELAQAWMSIVRDGIAPAKQIAAFDPQSYAQSSSGAEQGQVTITKNQRGQWMANGQPANPNNPVHAQAIASLNQQMGNKP